MATTNQSQDEEKNPPPKSPPTDPLPPHPLYNWSTPDSALSSSSELRFSDFEPCYIACIHDLEHRIKLKIQTIKPFEDNPGLASELTPLLIEYSSLISSFNTIIQTSSRVFEEDTPSIFRNHDIVTQFSGQKRRIATKNTTDDDRLHSHLRNNIILVVLGYIYNWDVANNLKRRFGNLSRTLDRVLVGLAGGASFLVPMILMTFLRTRTERLVIVSVATMLFAAGMAISSSDRNSVIGATAAYAAVMVVYIGSSEFA